MELDFGTLEYVQMINMANEAKKENKNQEISQNLQIITPKSADPNLAITFQFLYQ